jgi:cytochrome P450
MSKVAKPPPARKVDGPPGPAGRPTRRKAVRSTAPKIERPPAGTQDTWWQLLAPLCEYIAEYMNVIERRRGAMLTADQMLAVMVAVREADRALDRAALIVMGGRERTDNTRNDNPRNTHNPKGSVE